MLAENGDFMRPKAARKFEGEAAEVALPAAPLVGGCVGIGGAVQHIPGGVRLGEGVGQRGDGLHLRLAGGFAVAQRQGAAGIIAKHLAVEDEAERHEEVILAQIQTG